MDADLLVGWRAVANFFGRSPRTVQRWQAKFGLPVCTIGTRVLCSRTAIDLWILDQSARQRSAKAARAAVAVPTEPVMDEMVRAQVGAALRMRLNRAAAEAEERATKS